MNRITISEGGGVERQNASRSHVTGIPRSNLSSKTYPRYVTNPENNYQSSPFLQLQALSSYKLGPTTATQLLPVLTDL